MELDGVYTMVQAAAEAGVGASGIRKAVFDGRLKTINWQGRKLITAAELSRYKEEQGHRNGANAKKAK